jgi:predicted nuclease of predicted toxin-antitoxin system
MRFLADENFPRAAVDALLRAGHDVVWIGTAAPGMADTEVVSLAARERRIILTFDKDFGEIARTGGIPDCGVVLFRLPMPSAEAVSRLADLVAGRSDWVGHFSVVEPDRVRMRPLSQR